MKRVYNNSEVFFLSISRAISRCWQEHGSVSTERDKIKVESGLGTIFKQVEVWKGFYFQKLCRSFFGVSSLATIHAIDPKLHQAELSFFVRIHRMKMEICGRTQLVKSKLSGWLSCEKKFFGKHLNGIQSKQKKLSRIARKNDESEETNHVCGCERYCDKRNYFSHECM